MKAFNLTTYDRELRARVSLGFFGSERLAAQVRASYMNADEPYSEYRIEECVVDDGEPVIDKSGPGA